MSTKKAKKGKSKAKKPLKKKAKKAPAKKKVSPSRRSRGTSTTSTATPKKASSRIGRPPGIAEKRPRKPRRSAAAKQAEKEVRERAAEAAGDGEQGDLPLSDHARKVKADADLTEHKAERARLEREELLGRLISKEDVDEMLKARVLVLKRALLKLPERLAPQLAGMDVREAFVLLDDTFKTLIREFAGQKA